MTSKPHFKLQSCQRIVDQNNRIVMAEGRMMLLEKIVATGSINQAAKLMRMSYKSAWSKIRSTEQHFQMKIVHSDKAHGTKLTAAGRDLLVKYKQIKKRCLEADDAAFEASFYPEKAHITAGSPSTSKGVTHPIGVTRPILSFIGHSGSGKTTIIEKVITKLTAAGLKVAVIKHDVHGFEMDQPGKDSWRHKQAGAVATLVSSPSKIGLVMDSDHDHRPEILARLIESADLILTEGYKKEPHPKIEVFRPHATGDNDPLCKDDPALLAMISDEAIESGVPIFSTGDIEGVAAFIKSWLEQ